MLKVFLANLAFKIVLAYLLHEVFIPGTPMILTFLDYILKLVYIMLSSHTIMLRVLMTYPVLKLFIECHCTQGFA